MRLANELNDIGRNDRKLKTKGQHPCAALPSTNFQTTYGTYAAGTG